MGLNLGPIETQGMQKNMYIYLNQQIVDLERWFTSWGDLYTRFSVYWNHTCNVWGLFTELAMVRRCVVP